MALVQNVDSSPKRKMAGIVLEPSMLIDLKRVAAVQHYKSMSEMIRAVMKQYLEDVKVKMEGRK